MLRRWFIGASILIAALLLASPVAAQQRRYSPTFEVLGAVAEPRSYTLDALRAMPSRTVEVEFLSGGRTQQRQYTGVLLHDVMMASRPTFDSTKNNDALRYYVRASATDDYDVSFGWGEFDPGFGNRPILIAYLENGVPMGEGDGMARLIVPGDIRGGRYVSNLRSITLFAAGEVPAAARNPVVDLSDLLRLIGR